MRLFWILVVVTWPVFSFLAYGISFYRIRKISGDTDFNARWLESDRRVARNICIAGPLGLMGVLLVCVMKGGIGLRYRD
jgi:hypothetical protein